MTLDEAVRKFEARFDQINRRGFTAVSPIGKPYVVCALTAAPADEEKMIKMWLQAMEGHAGTDRAVYWRIMPEIARDDDGRVKIYSRFVTGAPLSAAAEKEAA